MFSSFLKPSCYRSLLPQNLIGSALTWKQRFASFGNISGYSHNKSFPVIIRSYSDLPTDDRPLPASNRPEILDYEAKIDPVNRSTYMQQKNAPSPAKRTMAEGTPQDITKLNILEDNGVIIGGYTANGYIINDNLIPSALLCYPSTFWAWNVKNIEDITIDSLAPIWLHNPAPSAFLFFTKIF